MIIVRCLFLMLFVTCFYGSDALAAGNSAPLASHNFFTPELKPSPDAFKLAKSTFLPETYDDLGLSGRHNTKYDFNKNDCSAYSLSSCPKGAKCSKCPFGNRYKLNSCQDGWRISGNSCVAASCSALNSNYKSAIPDNQICTKVTEGGLTCYKDCRAVSCDGYKINCDNGVSGSNITSSALCPDCMNDNAKCSPKLCKITTCADGYKINADATKCVEKDDTCPNGYYKTCETSTIGDPKYTERGTACYQCKPNKQQWEICAEKINSSYPGYSILTSSTVPSQGKGYVVVKDLTLSKLPGNVIYGAKHFSSISECSSLEPTLMIKTSDVTSEKIIGNSVKRYINRFEKFDIEDIKIHYDLTLEESYTQPILVYAQKATTSKLKNVTFSVSGDYFPELIEVYADEPMINTNYNIQLDIEGYLKIHAFSNYDWIKGELPRIRMIRHWTILNIKPGATVDFPGMDMASNVIINNATVKAARIATDKWRNGDIAIKMSNNAKLYFTNKIHLEGDVSLTGGSILYTPLITKYGSYSINTDNNSHLYKWDPNTGSTSNYGSY